MYNPTKPYKNKILDLIRKTWKTPYVSIKDNIYPIVRKGFNRLEIDHTDGIGTKGIYHWRKRTFKNAVLDALAMNLNDLAMARVVPYKLQNHIIIPTDDYGAILKILEHLSKECMKRKIAITGGETSIHDNTKGMDISITVSGFFPSKSKSNQFKTGDILIGIKSNGLHSNGFTKVREAFGSKFRPEFTVPTRIHLDQVLELDKKIKMNGLMHITGGAFTKLKQILPKNCDIIINRGHKLKPQKIFFELYKKGVSDEEMYKTFNCGIGFVFSVPPGQSEKMPLQKNMAVIGQVITGKNKISVESMFSNKIVIY